MQLAIVGVLVFLACIIEPASPPKKPEPIVEPEGVCLVTGNGTSCFSLNQI